MPPVPSLPEESFEGDDSMEELKLWKEKIRRCTDAYLNLFEGLEITIPEKGYLAGFHKPFFRKESWEILSEADNMHYPMGDAFLKYGIPGVLKWTAERNSEDTEQTAAYRRGVHEVYEGVREYIHRHEEKAEAMAGQAADEAERSRLLEISRICGKLADGRPETFREALQLFWFLYLLRSGFGGGCIGRLDQKLYPFVEKEKQKGSWDAQEALSDIVTVVLQKARLFKGTIRSNLLFSKKDATDDEMMRSLEIARAKEFVDKKGLDAPVEALGKNLSGGQRQRLSIARAVLKGARILVLDDSSSALDYKTESELRAELSKLDSTLVIVSQRASSMLHADKILVLDDGRIVACGRHEELLKSCPIYSEIYYTQFEKEEKSV